MVSFEQYHDTLVQFSSKVDELERLGKRDPDVSTMQYWAAMSEQRDRLRLNFTGTPGTSFDRNAARARWNMRPDPARQSALRSLETNLKGITAFVRLRAQKLDGPVAGPAAPGPRADWDTLVAAIEALSRQVAMTKQRLAQDPRSGYLAVSAARFDAYLMSCRSKYMGVGRTTWNNAYQSGRPIKDGKTCPKVIEEIRGETVRASLSAQPVRGAAPPARRY